MLKTKPILSLKEDSDGLRVSVMSRHTLEDGVTLNSLITPSSYDLWWPFLAPSPNLLGDYYKRRLPWEQFEDKYVEYLQQPGIRVEVRNLAIKSLDSVITLLCIEEFPHQCHRRLLAEECKKYQPDLALMIE
ncbi:DUF488 domain-containing protein [Candidatus Woesearchaeota archaeon]|nr:DUF488 domain-containing protein [Candidatus Woesearchaeota archaeon]